MRKQIALFSLAAIFAGCSPDSSSSREAETFGYRGHDLEDPDEQSFFLTGPGVTNWVPSRVLGVFENYEFTSNELALVSAAGIVTPGAILKEIPAGYAVKDEEPWYTSWTSEIEAFGRRGVAGFLSHFDQKTKLWNTGEQYFSTYHDSEAAARAALAELETAVAGFAPKKFYRFDRCWIAEYVRLRVMGVCGQRADGVWTCMLDISDKCLPGCGQWVPVDEQQARVDELAYENEVEAWRAAVKQKAIENHTAMSIRVKEAELPLFGESVKPQLLGDERIGYVRDGMQSLSNVVVEAVWAQRAKELSKAFAVRLGTVVTNDYGSHVIWTAEGSNRLFTAQLDVAFPKTADEGQGNLPADCEWRQLVIENPLPGFEPPPPPQRKK